MAVKQEYLDYISGQLSEFGDFDIKKMFGGVGFFRDGLMFAMVGGEKFRLKVDENNQADYEATGMKPYQPNPKKKGMPYWEVPEAILESPQDLKVWATKAYEAAVLAKK